MQLIQGRGFAESKEIMNLLDMDGAIDTLDKGDAAELNKTTNKNKYHETTVVEFRAACKVMASEIRLRKLGIGDGMGDWRRPWQRS